MGTPTRPIPIVDPGTPVQDERVVREDEPLPVVPVIHSVNQVIAPSQEGDGMRVVDDDVLILDPSEIPLPVPDMLALITGPCRNSFTRA